MLEREFWRLGGFAAEMLMGDLPEGGLGRLTGSPNRPTLCPETGRRQCQPERRKKDPPSHDHSYRAQPAKLFHSDRLLEEKHSLLVSIDQSEMPLNG